MACLKYSTSVTTACRDAQPGASKIYLANYADVASYAVDTAGTSITGITMASTGVTFYPVAVNKQVASFIDSPTISVANGVAISKPKLSFKVQGLTVDTIGMYKQLLQSDVIAVVKTINGDLFGIGFANGLSMSAGSLGTEAAVDGFIGATFDLEGIESTPMYKIATSFDFTAIVAGGAL
jgi:hypothetical protein